MRTDKSPNAELKLQLSGPGVKLTPRKSLIWDIQGFTFVINIYFQMLTFSPKKKKNPYFWFILQKLEDLTTLGLRFT